MAFFFCFGREKNERHGFSSLAHLLFFFLQKYGIALQHFFFFYTFHFWLCFGASANGPCSLTFFFFLLFFVSSLRQHFY